MWHSFDFAGRPSHFHLAPLLAALVGSGACSSEGGTSSPPPSTGGAGGGAQASGGSGGGAGGSRAAGGSGDPEGSGGEPAVEPTSWTVRPHLVIAQQERGHETTLHVIVRPPNEFATGERVTDACDFEFYDPQDTVAPRAHFSAITVTASGGSLEASPDSIGNYPRVTTGSSLWEPGTLVRFQAEGDGHPGFDASLPGPGPLEVTGPADGAVTVPFELRWTGGEHGSVVIALVATSVEGTAQLRCFVAPEEGSFTVTRALAEWMPHSDLHLIVLGENRQISTRDVDEVRFLTRTEYFQRQIVLED
jgi:hypothetical protein